MNEGSEEVFRRDRKEIEIKAMVFILDTYREDYLMWSPHCVA